MHVKQSMIMLFLCKKRLRSKQKTIDSETGKYKFTVQWKDTEIEKRINNETLIKMLHDIRDIINSNNEKIYYHMNDFIHFSNLAKMFIERIDNPAVKRNMSI